MEMQTVHNNYVFDDEADFLTSKIVEERSAEEESMNSGTPQSFNTLLPREMSFSGTEKMQFKM